MSNRVHMITITIDPYLRAVARKCLFPADKQGKGTIVWRIVCSPLRERDRISGWLYAAIL